MQRSGGQSEEACKSKFNSTALKTSLIYVLLIPAGFLIPVLFLCFSFCDRLADSHREFTVGTDGEVATSSDPPLRKCQQDCLEACANGARKIEMACGTGKTRVMKELVANISGRVSCPVCEEPSQSRSL